MTGFTDPWDGVRKPLNIPPYRRKGPPVAQPLAPAAPPPMHGTPNTTVFGPIGPDGWQDFWVYGPDGQLQGKARRKP